MLALFALVSVAKAGSITPVFGWANGDRWDVSYQETVERSGTGGSARSTVAASWTVTVSGAAGALSVQTSAVALGAAAGRPAGAACQTSLAASATGLVVDAKGGPLRLLPWPADSAAFAGCQSGARFQAEVEGLWAEIVGSWAGLLLVQGQPDSYAAVAPVSALAGASVQTDNTRVFDGPVPCASGGGPRCEAFTHHASLNRGAAGVAVGEFASRPGPLRVATVTMESTARLVTSAGDLRPRSLSIVRNTRSTGTAGATAVDVQTKETRNWVFAPPSGD
jgi:hypothetical protein